MLVFVLNDQMFNPLEKKKKEKRRKRTAPFQLESAKAAFRVNHCCCCYIPLKLATA